jgi:hypothetical protein
MYGLKLVPFSEPGAGWGSGYPTLATKTRTSRGWGTRTAPSTCGPWPSATWRWLHRCGPTVPQGLKPPALLGICGTAKAVPFQSSLLPGLKPGLSGMGFAGVETPASLRARRCAGGKSPSCQAHLPARLASSGLARGTPWASCGSRYPGSSVAVDVRWASGESCPRSPNARDLGHPILLGWAGMGCASASQVLKCEGHGAPDQNLYAAALGEVAAGQGFCGFG